MNTFSAARDLSTPCDEWQGYCDPKGYGRQSDHKRTALVHRRAWEDEHGEIPKDMHVLHGCDNPPCRNVDHLFLGTHQENMKDKCKKGRQSKGTARHNANLSENEVRDIRRTYVPNHPQLGTRALARHYSISQMAVSKIVNRKTWDHVK